MYKKKFRIGRRIKTVSHAVDVIYNKREHVYYRHKCYHWGWCISWPLITIARFVREGNLYKAKENV